MNLRSSSEVYSLGHRAVIDILKYPCEVTEKIDGSQFSFGIIDGVLQCRSKGANIVVEDPPKMFKRAVETISTLDLTPGWTYRGEVLDKPKHNTLEYARVPKGNVILWDIDRGMEDYLSPEEARKEAERVGLEFVPEVVLRGLPTDDPDFWNVESCLGGTKIEGVVIKPLVPLFGVDGKRLVAKLVRDDFKEKNAKNWRSENPEQNDILQSLVDELRNENRWLKAIQHLRDAGELQNAPQDIGPLLKEVNRDILKEEKEYIKDKLFEWAWKKIGRQMTYGFPEFYKSYITKELE